MLRTTYAEDKGLEPGGASTLSANDLGNSEKSSAAECVAIGAFSCEVAPERFFR